MEHAVEFFEFIKLLMQAPDGDIDQVYKEKIRDFLYADTMGDPVIFLRNIVDEMVFTSGCADIIVTAIQFMLDIVPKETAEQAIERRSRLKF